MRITVAALACVVVLSVARSDVLGQATNDAAEPVEQSDYPNLREIRERAERGEAVFQLELGTAYASGGLTIPPDYVRAAWWIKQAAEQGHALAQYQLGVMYFAGEGVERNPAEAVRWFRQSANGGEELAMYRLGIAYADGQAVPQDHVQAMQWFEQAAKRGLSDAAHSLGRMHAEGIGVVKDDLAAHLWFSIGAWSGHRESVRALEEIMTRLTPEQLALGERRLTEWLEQQGWNR